MSVKQKYSPILCEVQKLLSASAQVIIAIDGPCGSGKSSLADLLAGLYPSRVLHMDDYYLPLSQRPSGWEHIPCANMDLQRFLLEALLPAVRGEDILYRPYSCQNDRITESRRLPAVPLTIVEGSYSHHPLLAPHYDLRIFLTCQRQEQLRRLTQREKSRLDAYLQRWIPLEEAYYQTYLSKRSEHYNPDSKEVIYFDNTSFFVTVQP